MEAVETPFKVNFMNERSKILDSFALIFKNFSTGSRGFFGGGKLVIGDKAYQVSCNLVEIGSKPHAETNGKSA